jgi:hypothetical protein
MARDDDEDRPRRRRPVDDDEDDRPRKRRDDDDDDRPRKRRPVDEDDDDDRPRKRRRDDDDDDDDRPRKKKKKGGGKGLLIGLIAGGSVVVIGLVVLLIILLSGGGLASQILGKWKTEVTLNGVIPQAPPGFDPKVKMDIIIIAEFKADGVANMDMEMKLDLGKFGSKGEKKKETGTYKIDGQYLLTTEKGRTEKIKVEIRGDEMTWSDFGGISAEERQDMKAKMGIDFPTRLTWKRTK